MYYAVTITPSPYKNKYKDKSYDQQCDILASFMNRYRLFFDYYEWIFEACPTSGNAHIHACLHPKVEPHNEDKYLHSYHMNDNDIMSMFKDYILQEFGYGGKHNSPLHFVKFVEISNMIQFDRWQNYMYKEYDQVRIVGR